MGKKGLKRKTRWRPLSITECTGDDTTSTSAISITNSTTETNIEEDDTSYKYSAKNSSYLRRKPIIPFSSSSTNRTDYRNNYNNINNNNNNNNYNNNTSNNYYRNNNSNISNKHNNNALSSTTTSSSSTRYSSYRRRPFSSNYHQNDSSISSHNNTSNKYYSSRGVSIRTTTTSNNRIHRRISAETSDKENISLKPQLNEDEYTRITTPRQDVIFKKSYLNQPRRYLSSTDTNTTSSAAASIVSTEESISATSVPSLSPEQCSSMAESIDLEQGFMYSYFDQNGVFYVNPFIPNGFDQYGQMFMLPYGYSPYMYPQDINSPSANGDAEESQVSDELNESKSDLKDSDNDEIVNNEIKLNKNLSESCDSIQKTLKCNEENKENIMNLEETGREEKEENKEKEAEIENNNKITIKKDEKNENNIDNKSNGAIEEKIEKKEEKEKVEENEPIPQELEVVPPLNVEPTTPDYFGYGYQQFYPPMFYPYMYSQPFIPIFAEELTNPVEFYSGDDIHQSGSRRRKRIKLDESVTDVTTTTTDYSENGDECTDEDDVTEIPENTMGISDTNTDECEICDNYKENRSINNDETESKQIKFNTDVKEFVPKINNKPHLNVHVKEFKPRNHTSSLSFDEQKSIEIETPAEIKCELTAEIFVKEQTVTEEAAKITQKKETKLSEIETISKLEKSITPQKSIEIPESPSSEKIDQVLKQKPQKSAEKGIEIPKEEKPQILKHSIEKSTMTLAEKIKKNLSEELKLKSNSVSVSPSSSSNSRSITPKPQRAEKKFVPPKNNTSSYERPPVQQRKKASQRKNESRNQVPTAIMTTTTTTTTIPEKLSATTKASTRAATTKSVPTYAQMLNNNGNKAKYPKNQNPNEKLNNAANITPATEESTNKELPIESPQQQQQNESTIVQSNHTTAENIPSAQQVWLTVKSKGKRGKQVTEVTVVDDEIILEEKTPVKMDQVNVTREISKVTDKRSVSPINVVKKTEALTTIETVESKLETTKLTKDSSPTNKVLKNETSSNLSNQKKGAKSKNKKSRKTAILGEKLKGFELKEPRIEMAGKKNKSKEKDNRNLSSSSFESQKNKIPFDVDVENLLQLTPSNVSEEDLTVEHLYSQNETMKNFSRSFAHNSLDLLSGFDYKSYKGSSILKEEEEMVLNVIKSLSCNQKKPTVTIKTVENTSNSDTEDIKIKIPGKTLLCDIKEKNINVENCENDEITIKNDNKDSFKIENCILASERIDKDELLAKLEEAELNYSCEYEEIQEMNAVKDQLNENNENKQIIKCAESPEKEERVIEESKDEEPEENIEQLTNTLESSEKNTIFPETNKSIEPSESLSEESIKLLESFETTEKNTRKFEQSGKSSLQSENVEEKLEQSPKPLEQNVELSTQTLEPKQSIVFSENAETTKQDVELSERAVELSGEDIKPIDVCNEAIKENSENSEHSVEYSDKIVETLGKNEKLPEKTSDLIEQGREIEAFEKNEVFSEISAESLEQSYESSQQSEEEFEQNGEFFQQSTNHDEQRGETLEEEREDWKKKSQLSLENKYDSQLKSDKNSNVETSETTVKSNGFYEVNGENSKDEITTNKHEELKKRKEQNCHELLNVSTKQCNGIQENRKENEEFLKEKKVLCNGNISAIIKNENNSKKNFKKSISSISVNSIDSPKLPNGFHQEGTSEEISKQFSNNKILNGKIDEENSHASLDNTKTQANYKTNNTANDFYQLIKLDENTSTSIADQLKILEDQLKNLERIASVTSLNDSRSDISDAESTTTTSTKKKLKTAENSTNSTTTISTIEKSNNSIPSSEENLVADEFAERKQNNERIEDNNFFKIDKNDCFTDSSGNFNKKSILVPNDHVLNGCEEKSQIIIKNEFETRNESNCCSSQNIQHQEVKVLMNKNEESDDETSRNCIRTQTKNEFHSEKQSPSSIDRIRSNSFEGYSNNLKSFQQQEQEQQNRNQKETTNVIPVCNNTKAISDSSLNTSTSLPNNKYPLTNAVRQWLKDNTKEKTPEQLLRIPNDPKLSTRIKTSLQKSQIHDNDNLCSEEEERNDDDEEEEVEVEGDNEEENEIHIKQNDFLNESHHPKNLLSNPSHVSSVKNCKINRLNLNNSNFLIDENDNDSDYNSDSQNHLQQKQHQQYHQNNNNKRYDYDDNTCERVALLILSDAKKISTEENEDDENDKRKFKIDKIITTPPSSSSLSSSMNLLEYWDDEFIQNPKKWLKNSIKNDFNKNDNDDYEKSRKKRRKKFSTIPQSLPRTIRGISLPNTSTSTSSSSSSSSIIDEIELVPYESVYGKTIDYNRLLNENHCEFLSNTIISFNNKNNNLNNNNNNNNNDNDTNKNIIIKNFNNDIINENNNNNNDKNLSSLNYNNFNNFDNNMNVKFKNNNNNNNNCLKPPEVCCILM